MFSVRLVPAALALASVLWADAPFYTTTSVVNSADNLSGSFAPNSIATVYGTTLAWGTKALTADDIRGGILPTVLPGTGVRVLVGNLPANLYYVYYVSPGQINFLIPPNLLPGRVNFQIVVDGLAGPEIFLQIGASAPALFQSDAQTPIATRLDGSLITASAPAKPGDIVILYATGLGQAVPTIIYGQLPMAAAPLKQMSDFVVLLDATAVPSGTVTYAGVAPGFAGLYQINMVLPSSTGANPELRIGLADSISPAGLRLPVQP